MSLAATDMIDVILMIGIALTFVVFTAALVVFRITNKKDNRK